MTLLDSDAAQIIAASALPITAILAGVARIIRARAALRLAERHLPPDPKLPPSASSQPALPDPER
jgi:hypothetical protein